MRKFVFALAMLFLATNLQAQELLQGKYVNSASARLTRLVDAANKDGYKLSNNSFSIGGGWLKQNTDWTPLYTIELQAGKEYRFVAVGDMDARDVDLQVRDANGNTVASDTSTAPEAIVTYTPTKSGRYMVRLRLFASRDNVPCVCMAITLTR